MQSLIFSVILLMNVIVVKATPTTSEVNSALDKAAKAFYSINNNGGYVGIYSVDFSETYGEGFYESASPDEIWVQPPGTPSVGEAYLRMYELTGNMEYLEFATEAALSLCWGQHLEGGWDHRVDVSHRLEDPNKITRHSGRCTFDDKISQAPMMFLMKLDTYIDREWLTESIELAMNFMMESQFDNGAWPQWYPLRGGYHDYYTFNDNVINDNIRVMMHAYQQYGNKKFLESAEAAGQFMIDSQWKSPQFGWAQQYNHNMEPAWARRFEPPGICSAVTVRNINSLIDLYLFTGNEKYLNPIPNAIHWLRESQISDNLWARLYEVGTNREVYGDREDGDKLHYDYDSISERERTSYGWRGSYGASNAFARFEYLQAHGNLEGYDVSDSGTDDTMELRKQAASVINNLNKDGFWVTERTGWDTDAGAQFSRSVISSGAFVNNINILCDYLESL